MERRNDGFLLKITRKSSENFKKISGPISGKVKKIVARRNDGFLIKITRKSLENFKKISGSISGKVKKIEAQEK